MILPAPKPVDDLLDKFLRDVMNQQLELRTKYNKPVTGLLVGYETFHVIFSDFMRSPICKYGFLSSITGGIESMEIVLGMKIFVDPMIKKRCTLLMGPWIDVCYRANSAAGKQLNTAAIDIEVRDWDGTFL